MKDNKKVLAIIPARGKSKRIPRKNIKLLVGKPLIAYTIEAGKKSRFVDRIITSTDDREIIRVAKKFGSEVPFIRPGKFAGDTVKDFPVIEHALKWLMKHENYIPDIIVQLRPTSPLRTAKEIDDAIELLCQNPKADSVRTVTKPDQSPYKMYKINNKGFSKPLLSVRGLSESYNMPEQKLPKVYKQVGYVDAIWSKTILKKKHISGKKIIPLILNEAYSGINTMQDWWYYEFLIKTKRKKNRNKTSK